MNVLVVEDEPGIRTRVATMIPWERHGIDIVGVAENGEEALRLMDRTKPDIVLTDVSMPGMDGITLAGRIAQHNPTIRVIILSGYDDFDYARSAMEYGVQKYLLKPASNEEIRDAVVETAEKVRAEREQRHNHETLALQWKNHLPRLREHFFLNWIRGAYAQWELDLKSRDLQIGLDRTSCYTVVLFDMDPLPEEEHRFQEKDSGLLQFSLKSIAGEIIYDHNGGVFQDEQGRCVVLFQSTEEGEGEFKLRIGYSVAKVLTTVKEILKVTASAGISGTGIGGDAVPLLYGQAKDSLQKRVMYGRDIAIPYSEEQDVSDKVTLPSSAERELEIGIETGNLAKAEAAILQLAELSLDQAGTVEEAQVCVLHLFHLFFQIAKSNNWAIQEAAGEDFVYFGSLQSLQTREQVIGCLVRIARSLAKFALEKSQAKGGGAKLIQSILDTVEKEIDQDISLHAIAGRFFINSSYLSRLFKHEVGETFSDYVVKRKMIRAKQHLQDGSKVQDAAQKVGYTNVGYFSKLFQRYWGVLPSEIKQG